MLNDAHGASDVDLPGKATGNRPLKDIPQRRVVGKDKWMLSAVDNSTHEELRDAVSTRCDGSELYVALPLNVVQVISFFL